ncbi:MAG: sulfite exporter TauE/SafE family protein [Sphingobacteriales bacterium]|nr:MAG: sulfite exporter TauE/SafE family protein [Sphingobacteriales bacterium]
MNTVVWISSLLLGLASSLHCLGMCGPLIMAVPFPVKSKNRTYKLFYFLGKALAYGSLGAIIGALGLKAIWGEAQRYVSILSGILIMLLVLLPMMRATRLQFPFQKTFARVFNRIQEHPRWFHFMQLGFLNGLLPCGMVYIALTAALASGSPLNGFVAMMLFGAGTSVVLWGVALLKGKLSGQLRQKLKPVSTGFSILVGGLLIARGLNLGIPYISPEMNTVKMQQASCCGAKAPVAATKSTVISCH